MSQWKPNLFAPVRVLRKIKILKFVHATEKFILKKASWLPSDSPTYGDFISVASTVCIPIVCAPYSMCFMHNAADINKIIVKDNMGVLKCGGL